MSSQASCRAPAPLAFLLLMAGAIPSAADTQLGTEFWLAWPETPDLRDVHPDYDVDARLILLAGDGPARVRVQGPGLDEIVDLAPGAPGFVRLPRQAAMVTAADIPVAQGVHVEVLGCGAIAALLRVPGSEASYGDDVARLFPVKMLGTRYLPTAYEGQAEFVVVATEDDTTVAFTDPHCPERPPQVLQRGEALLHRCNHDGSDRDVTGALVEASAPVAVISGSASSEVVSHQLSPTLRVQWQFQDVLLESTWPMDLFGRTHVHAPFRHGDPEASGDLVRVMAGCGDSLAWVEEAGRAGRHVALAEAGADMQLVQLAGFTQRLRLSRAGTVIQSDRPMQVTAMTVGNTDAGIGDPSMTVLDPVERWEREALAWLPEGYEHSLAIVAPAGATASVLVDGQAPAGPWQPVGRGGEWSWLRIDDVAAGEHRVEAAAPISVQVSGHLPDGAEGSYSYPAIAVRPDRAAGLRIASSADPCRSACPGSCVELAAPAGLAELAWSNGDLGLSTVACLSDSSTLSLTAVDEDGCLHAGGARVPVDVSIPVAAIAGPKSTCPGGCVTLEGVEGYAAYEWSTGETSRVIQACLDSPGRFTLQMTGRNGCTVEIEHEVSLEAAPTLGPASAEILPPCTPGIRVSWPAAAWRPGSPGGTYHLWRRGGSCEEGDGWELVASGLAESSYIDRELVEGERVSYRVEAEDAATEEPCGGGPSWGGQSVLACAEPDSLLVPPAAEEPLSLSPWLRADGRELGSGGRALSVRWQWTGAGSLGAGGGIEVLAGTRPDELQRLAWIDPVHAFTDEGAGRAELLYYRVVRIGPCGDRGF